VAAVVARVVAADVARVGAGVVAVGPSSSAWSRPRPSSAVGAAGAGAEAGVDTTATVLDAGVVPGAAAWAMPATEALTARAAAAISVFLMPWTMSPPGERRR
jgi:hypothetical protein